MNGHKRFRFWFGLSAAVILFVVLTVHLKGAVKLDNVALGLLAGVAACLAFAFAGQLGIIKIGAGSASIELAKDAAGAIKREDRGQFSEVLANNSDLFPVVGARILWVDDHPEELIAHRQVLRRLGLQVVFVTSSDEAIAELKRDADFALLIQDNLRAGSNDDAKRSNDNAKKLVKWVAKEGRPKHKLLAPLIVYSFDQHDETVGVIREDWITSDFSKLLSRLAQELRIWRLRFPDPQEKSPA
jgi:hypothetical protein